MVIKYIEDIRDNLSILTNFIRSINVQGLLESTLLLKLTEEDEPEVLRLLNSITNQKIERVDINRHCYTIDGVTLSFYQFSTSELLFLLAYAADKTKTEVYFYNDIPQLSGTTLKKFIRYFYDSPYVNIAYKANDLDLFFNDIVVDAISK